LDHFTGVNGTNLSAHAMDLGPGWTIGSGSFTIQSNIVSSPTQAAEAHAWADAGQSDVTVTATVKWTGTETGCGFFVRVTDNLNGYLALLDATGVYIFSDVAGTLTQRAFTSAPGGTFIANTPYTLTCVMSGQSITVSSGAYSASYTSSFNQTATKHGLRFYGGHSGTGTWDDFTVTQP
jgi:hypothetical protein